MNHRRRDIMWPLFLVAITVVGILAALNAIPQALRIQAPIAGHYRSLDAAESALQATILSPRYFPYTLSWPPSTIRIDSDTVHHVTLIFQPRQTGRAPFMLTQHLTSTPATVTILPPPNVQFAERRTLYHGLSVEIMRGTENAVPEHLLYFDMADRRVELRGDLPLAVMERMAQSMIP